jgi:hypothetical protein
MPSDPGERLDLRLKEASAVERSARDTARHLLVLLQQGSDADGIRVGFDRLEKEALELNRKLLAVRDELGAGVEARENREVERLDNEVERWRQFAVENRSAETRVAAARLELLLHR